MSRSFSLPGGSAGSKDMGRRGPKTGMFQTGVRHAFASGDREIKGRFLPAFDLSLSREDKQFSRSWVPYRNMAADPSEYDEETKTPPFTAWFQVFRAYRFFGKSSDSFISPLTLRGVVSDSESRCPVFDCFMKAKKSDNDTWLALLKSDKGDKNERGVLPAPSILAAANMYLVSDKGEWDNVVYTMPQASLIDLKAKLSQLTPRSMPEPYDPDFPDFLFGDITNPSRGLIVTGTKLTLATNSMIKYNGFRIGRSDKTLEGVASKAVNEDVLARRWDLMSDKTLKILSAQEIVDLLLDDGCLPLDLIQEACSEYADVNVSRTRRLPADEMEGGKGYPDSRKTESKAPPVDTDDGEQYWCPVEGKTVKVYASFVQLMIDDHGVSPSKIKLMKLDKTGGWQTAEAMGFSATPPPDEDDAPPPPDEDDAPPPPDEDDAPPPPDEDDAPAPAKAAAKTKTKAKAAEGGLTADEAEELAEISAKVVKGENLEPAQLSRLVQLNLKKGGN